MRRLILLRHAKSSWSDPNLDDFDRPLSNRGKRDAPFIANIFSKYGILPELILSSPSKRTKQTVKEFLKVLNKDKIEIIWNNKIYMASEFLLMKILSEVDDNYKNVMLVGHNPGLTNLYNLLADEKIDNIPTCGLIGLITENKWSKIKPKSFKTDFFEYPKKYLK